MRIRSQIALQSVLLAAVPLAIAGVIFHQIESRRLLEAETSAKQSALDRFRRVGAESIINKDDFLIVNFAKSFQESPEVVLAVLFDAEGRVLFHSEALRGDASLIGTKLAAPWAAGAQASPSPLCRSAALPAVADLCSAPVLRVGQRIGTAALAFDPELLARRRKDALRAVERRFMLVALVSLLGGLTLSLILAYRVTRPLERLSSGAREIGEGRLDTRIQAGGSHEVLALSAEFNRMAEKLSELDKLKDAFLRNVSHELRSPLFAIQGHLQIMELDASVSPQNRERLVVMDESCRRLLKLVNDILDLAKMQARRMSYEMTRTPVSDAVTPVLANFQGWAQNGGVKLLSELAPGLPAVRADGARVQQVLTNLVSNALKFTPAGGVVTVTGGRDGKFVVLGVRDSGPGIPADKIGLLFKTFSQVPGAASGKTPGTGLGLAISKEIVEAHGGAIWAESSDRGGSVFKFTLPVAEGA